MEKQSRWKQTGNLSRSVSVGKPCRQSAIAMRLYAQRTNPAGAEDRAARRLDARHFITCCLRFTTGVAARHARLASGRRAAPLPGGSRIRWIATRGSGSCHPLLQGFAWRKKDSVEPGWCRRKHSTMLTAVGQSRETPPALATTSPGRPKGYDVTSSHDLHLREDLDKPENRVNVALFSLMQQHWFREWILNKLGLPADAIVYPPTNQHDRRPDLKVVNIDGEELAWIEVELGKNDSQYEDYAKKFGRERVKRLLGKRSHQGDLSLEEVAERVDAERGLHPQVAKNAEQLILLIGDGLAAHSQPIGRSRLSPEMRSHPLVGELCTLLGDRLQFELGDTEPPDPGQLKGEHDRYGQQPGVFAPGVQPGVETSRQDRQRDEHHRRSRSGALPVVAEAPAVSSPVPGCGWRIPLSPVWLEPRYREIRA